MGSWCGIVLFERVNGKRKEKTVRSVDLKVVFLLFANFPEMPVAADIEGITRQGRGAEDGGGKIKFPGDGAFGCRSIDGLQEAAFAHGIQSLAGENRTGRKGSLQPEFPWALAGGKLGARQNPGSVDGEDLFSVDQGAGGAGVYLGGLP